MLPEPHHEELKRFVRFTSLDAGRIAGFGTQARSHFPRIAGEVVDRLREHEDAHAALAGEERAAQLADAIRVWLDQLFGGVYDAAYFATSERLGRLQLDLGLPQRYVIAAMAFLRSALLAVLREIGGDDVVAGGDALSRMLDLDLATMLACHHAHLLRRIELARGHAENPGAQSVARALAAAPVAVIAVDGAGDIRGFNQAAERLTGYASEEAFGKSFQALLVPTADHDEHAWKHAPGRASVVETSLRQRSGTLRTTRWRMATSESAPGLTLGFGDDITDEVAARNQTDRERRLAALGTLAGGLAHAVRNPLHGARLHVAYLERALVGATPDILDALVTIRGEIQRLSRLVTHILDYARPAALVLERTPVAPLLARMLEGLGPLATNVGAVVELDLPATELVVLGDPSRLSQMLVNLVRNAVEALAPGGKVVVRARREPALVRIEVEDNGCGFRPDAPVFDPLYSTKHGATGLGLAIVHRIVTDHRGTIDVTTQPGRTLFRVHLPTPPSRIPK